MFPKIFTPTHDRYVFKYVANGRRTPSPDEIEVRRIARDLKLPTSEAIAEAAPKMAALIDGPCWLVPVPACDGTVAANLALANAIAEFADDLRVKCAVGRDHPVESSCDRRRRFLPGLTFEEHCIIRLVESLEILPLYFVDNVITTGTTIEACRLALGWGTGLAYADASYRSALSLGARWVSKARPRR